MVSKKYRLLTPFLTKCSKCDLCISFGFILNYCMVYGVQCTTYIVSGTVHSAQCTGYIAQCTVLSAQCVGFSDTHLAVTVGWAEAGTVQVTMVYCCTVQCVYSAVQYTVCIVQFKTVCV